MYPSGPQSPKSQPFTATSLTPTGAGGLGGYGLSTGTINRAGITPEVKTLSDASQMRVVIHRAGTVVLDKPYSEILAGGDVIIQKGDEIVVSPNSQVVTILGAVQRSGNLPIVKQSMTLADALGEASGLSDVASNRTGVYIFRSPDAGNNRGRIFRLDLLQPVSVFVAQQFAMHPGDVLYVTNAPLYEFDKTLTPLYRTLVVLRTGRQY
jgi:polysaccharide export outer membrane protein